MSSETIATSPQPCGPRRRRRPDWRRAAALIASGHSPQSVAGAVGTHPKYVLRQLRQSRRLGRWIAQDREILALLSAFAPATNGDTGFAGAQASPEVRKRLCKRRQSTCKGRLSESKTL